jgi:hypothetical protein
VSSAIGRRYSAREAEEAELRAGVLRLGSEICLDGSSVARLAEAVTGRCWSSCGRDELLHVLTVYAALAARVRAAQARLPGGGGPRCAARTGTRDHRWEPVAGGRDELNW